MFKKCRKTRATLLPQDQNNEEARNVTSRTQSARIRWRAAPHTGLSAQGEGKGLRMQGRK